jgi:predicted RNA binding protein YcfA (HicA-like mRNA interferase family)
LKRLTGSQFARILEKNGWELRRVKGSHHVYVKEGNPARISIPIHGSKQLKIGLLKHLIKIAEISEKEL